MIPILTPRKGLTLTCDRCGETRLSHYQIPLTRHFLDPTGPAVYCTYCSGHGPARRGFPAGYRKVCRN